MPTVEAMVEADDALIEALRTGDGSKPKPRAVAATTTRHHPWDARTIADDVRGGRRALQPSIGTHSVVQKWPDDFCHKI